ncbi:response regulator [Pseudoalteromonas sp. MMG005]|uniref:response regulator n=1 Tax=Pseudoalteromonas sp. MMG005 TaxID=2822682 RepID=UPI001B3A0181|nr:response regulator [Pseudoalteromonas sp. MMG005]MBQ4846165.1 response regulator [Pseudoalteromonas sp. MMG005]
MQLVNLNIAIIDENKTNVEILSKMLQSLGVFNVFTFNHPQQFVDEVETQQFDMLFLDHNIDQLHNHYDMISDLIFADKLLPTTRLIYLAPENTSFDYTCEYPFHSTQMLIRPFNTAQISEQLKLHVLQITEFKTAYHFISQKHYKRALLHLKNLRNRNYPNYLKKSRNQLLVNLLQQLGQYSIAKKLLVPLAKKHIHWASWSLFHVNYELKELDKCKQFLASPLIQKVYPVRVFYWQIYLSWQTGKRDIATEQVLAFELDKMSPMMLRLSLMTLHANNETNALENLFNRTQTIRSDNIDYQNFIACLRARTMILSALFEQTDIHISNAKQSLIGVQKTMQATQPTEFSTLMVALMTLDGNNSVAKGKLYQLAQHSSDDPIQIIFQAYLYHHLGEHQDAFECIYTAHQLINRQLKNCQHVLAGLMHKIIFEHMYHDSSSRARAYEKLGQRVYASGEYKNAVKIYGHALNAGVNSNEIKSRLEECIHLSGITDHFYQTQMDTVTA